MIADIKKAMDGRNQSHITYEIEAILYMIFLKNVSSITSAQKMNAAFNEGECVKNIYKILVLKEKEHLPHYVTINQSINQSMSVKAGHRGAVWTIQENSIKTNMHRKDGNAEEVP